MKKVLHYQSFKYILVLGICLIFGNSWAQSTYTLVTSAAQLQAGGKYLVTNSISAGTVQALGPQNTNNRTEVDITVSGSTISATPATLSTDTTKPFEITLGGSSGAWTLSDAVNGTILGPNKGTGANNYLKANATGTPTFTIVIAASGSAATITCFGTEANSTRNIVRYNSGSGLFACYASGQADVFLYKLSPLTTTDAATGLTSTGATLNGKIYAANTTMAAKFEYGTTTGYGTSVTGTPATVSGSTQTSYSATIGSLLPNTLYNFRAFGDNSGVITNGTNKTFYTLANVPGAPVVNNPALTTLDVSLDAATINSNSVLTTYAIYEVSTGKYLQSTGVLNTTAVYQTASAWGTKTVTGLTNNTTYTFQVKARNQASTDTALGAQAQGTTLANTAANFQSTVLADFGNVCLNTTTVPKSFTLTGTNLTTANIAVGPLTGYSFSTVSGGTYTSTLALVPSSGALSQVIYVELTPATVQSYNGSIPVTGGGFTGTYNVSATGAGVNTGVVVTTGTATSQTAVGATLPATIVTGCSSVTAYGIEYSTTNGFANGSGTQQVGSNLSSNSFSVTLSTLQPSTTYYYKGYAVDATGTKYGSQSSFTTSAIVAPTTTTATGLQSGQFTANWNAVAGAQSYRLDVSAFSTFSNTALSENFAGFTTANGTNDRSGSLNSYLQTTGWTGTRVYEMSGYAKLGSGSGNGVITTPTVDLSGGAATFSFDLQDYGSDGSVVQVFHAADGTNFVQVGSDITSPATMTRQNVTITNGTANSKIRLQSTTSRFYLDNVTVSKNALLTGYADLNVGNVTSYPVTGLTESTTYYYRVRAVNGSNTSANSGSTTAVTTAIPTTLGGISQQATVCENLASTFLLTGLTPSNTFTLSYNINGGSTQTISSLVANAAGESSFQLTLAAVNNGQTLTVSSMQRNGASAVAISANNTVVLAVSPNVTPAFTQVSPICSGATLAALPTSSTNGISGTWSPSVNNTATTLYTFTPTAGQCATTATMTITVNPNVTPAFTQVSPICSGATLSALPTSSTNGISGTWSPAVNNTATTLYTFTPTAGQCATTTTMTITVNPNVTPAFTQVSPICSGATLSALPTASTNGISGTWSPTLNNTATTLYTFTPTAGQCATTTTMTITVNPNVTPAFTQVSPICSGATLAALSTNSTNGISGTWSPAVNNTATTEYTFTPTAGQCATTATMTITVNPNVTPAFTQVSPICSGATLAALPTASTNGITGTWSPALNNTATTLYTFTPTAGQCATTTTMTITVNPIVTPTFDAVPVACQNSTIAALPTTSTNGVSGTWSPAINNTATTEYTFTPTAGQCANTTLTKLTITVSPNVTYYRDADGDTFGDASVSMTSCTGQPGGYVLDNTDCDDTDGNSHQRFSFYVDADHDGHGVGNLVAGICAPNNNTPPVGYALTNDDCDDLHATVYPGAAEIPYDGLDNNCNNDIDEGYKIKTKLLPSFCGSTLTSLGSLIGITTLAQSNQVTGYRIRVTNGSTVQVIDRSLPNFTMTMFPSYEYATTYTVEIQVQRNGVYLGYYGDPCFISTPAVLDEGGATSVSPALCGQRVAAMTTLVATTPLNNATGYRFRITDITVGGTGLVQTIDRPLYWFAFTMLDHYNYNATYTVEVAVKTTGAYSGFGSPCEVSTPLVPITSCGITAASATTPITALSVNGAAQYRFIVTKMPENSPTTIDRATNFFTFSMIPGYVRGGRYSVRVATLTKDNFSTYSDACTVFAPGGAVTKAEVDSPVAIEGFNAVASPNPFASDFAISVTTPSDEQVHLKVYDMLGKLIESREVEVSNLEGQKVGARYAAGVYNVIVTQGTNVKTLRVIKR